MRLAGYRRFALEIFYVWYCCAAYMKQQQQAQAQGERCLLTSNDSSKRASVCERRYDTRTKILHLNNCSERNANLLSIETCSVQSINELCGIDIELHRAIEYAEHFKSSAFCDGHASPIRLNITLRSISIKHETSVRLFANIEEMTIDKFEIDNCDWLDEKNFKKLLETNLKAKMFERLVITNLASSSSLASYSFQGLSPTTLEVINGDLSRLSSHTFALDPPVRNLKLIDLNLSGKMANEFISIGSDRQSSCDQTTYSVSINRCGLTNESLGNKSISFKGGACNNSRFTIDLYDNQFGGLIDESVFEHYIVKQNVAIKFEPLKCCEKENFWLFNLAREERLLVQSDCSDLGASMADFENKSALEDVCNRRNVYPIFLIAIVSILLLAILMGAFSCVCIFYVLPRKRLIIKTKTKASKKLATKKSLDKSGGAGLVSSKESTGSQRLTPIEAEKSTATQQTDAKPMPDLMSQSKSKLKGSKVRSHPRKLAAGLSA